MNDEEIGINTKMNGLLKVIIFSVVGVILISTLAIPILASAGTVNISDKNEGQRYSVLDTEYCEQHVKGFASQFDFSQTTYIVLAPEGLCITGEKDGEAKTITLASISSFDTDYPVCFSGINTTAERLTYYTYSNGQYTANSINGTTTNTSLVVIDSDSQAINSDQTYIQDPNGKFIMSPSEISVPNLSDPDMQVWGLYISTGKTMISTVNMTQQTTKNGTDTPVNTSGDTVISAEQYDDYLTVTALAYNGTACMFLFSNVIEYATHTENFLEGSTVGTIIGLIPLLMIVGVVMYILRNMNLSDR